MEVHAHTHSARKKWTHYFWEFLMLFLAVTLGFFVENKREHMVEHNREEKYISSLIQDLKADTANLQIYMNLKLIKKSKMDSLLMLLTNGGYKQSGNETYFFFRYVLSAGAFVSTDGTMQQLKSSGNLRLIRKQNLANKILEYDRAVKSMQNQDETDKSIRNNLREIGGNIYSADALSKTLDTAFNYIKPANNPQLLTDDPITINKVAFQVHYLSAVTLSDFKVARLVKSTASNLIELLKKEYHLQ
jgi:hypothetical protein